MANWRTERLALDLMALRATGFRVRNFAKTNKIIW